MASTPPAPHVPSVDGFRGLAVLWIMLGHCWNEFGTRLAVDSGPLLHLLVSSYMGVDVLFVVSGFVLFLPVVIHGSAGEMSDYARRRTARIVPAFYVFLLFSYAVAHVVGTPKGGSGAWISHPLFLHAESHDAATEVGFGVNGAMWTMSVEVWFYVALPLVARWYRRHPFAGLALAVIGAQLWQHATVKLPQILDRADVAWSGVHQGQMRMALGFPSYAAHFAIGMTAAWLFVQIKRYPDLSRERILLLQAAAFIGLAANVWLRVAQGFDDTAGPFDHHVRTLDRASLIGCLVLATALAPRAMQWPVRNTLSRLLGTVSYGTYLVHLPLIKLLFDVLGFDRATPSNADLLRLVLVVVPVSVFVGIASYRYLEEPFRRWARRGRLGSLQGEQREADQRLRIADLT